LRRINSYSVEQDDRIFIKPLILLLILLLGVMQYKLWFSSTGLANIKELQHRISKQRFENDLLQRDDSAIMADISDLKEGQAAIEERARYDLGMIKEGEIFYQIER